MPTFNDKDLAEIGNEIDEQGSQRLGEVASYALQNKEFRSTAFSPKDVRARLTGEAGLQQRLDRQDLGSLSDAEIRYCEAWARLATQRFGSDDAQLVGALNAEAGDRGPAG